MGWKDLFKKKDQDEDLTDLRLDQIKPGYFVDYDLKTWEVKAYNKYDWGSGEISDEWHLVSSDDAIFLEREVDDEEAWLVTRKISFNKLGASVRSHILEHEDPPNEITYENRTYYLEDSAGGYFHPDGKSDSYELVSWTYEDDSGDRLLGIEQWGEQDFAAWVGIPAEDYQFTNILPRQK
ncbi:hypothetical protein MHK_007383 [Candidatus Magnetomorum sp. HK-1]|nr:hypothetical protein MHK_007383 [Candidatus Magnetomorum sp. HK-1]